MLASYDALVWFPIPFMSTNHSPITIPGAARQPPENPVIVASTCTAAIRMASSPDKAVRRSSLCNTERNLPLAVFDSVALELWLQDQ